jgi:hypothetical protein
MAALRADRVRFVEDSSDPHLLFHFWQHEAQIEQAVTIYVRNRRAVTAAIQDMKL